MGTIVRTGGVADMFEELYESGEEENKKDQIQLFEKAVKYQDRISDRQGPQKTKILQTGIEKEVAHLDAYRRKFLFKKKI